MERVRDNQPTDKVSRLGRDLADLGFLCLAIAVILFIVFAGVLLGHWFSDVLYRAGDRGTAADFIAHIAALFITLGVILTIGARIAVGTFWWRG